MPRTPSGPVNATRLQINGIDVLVDPSVLYLRSADTSSAAVSLTTNGSPRFIIRKSGAETGGNSGGNLTVERINDGGTGFVALRIERATGVVTMIGGAVTGSINPAANAVYALGSGGLAWSDLFLASGAISNSDAQLKREILPISDELLDAWAAVEWRAYRFKSAYAEKGENARWHFGLIAQQVRDVIDARLGEGQAVRHGLVCHDAWPATDAVLAPIMEDQEVLVDTGVRGEDGEPVCRPAMIAVDTGETMVVQEARPAGERWALRYDECDAVEAAYQRRRMDRIEARLAAMEAPHG